MSTNHTSSTILGSLLSTAYAPVQQTLISYLEPAEFVALSAVSKHVRICLQDGLRSTCYNIDAKLSRFFNSPKEFRRTQAITGALIDGPFALAFFMNKGLPNKLQLKMERAYDNSHTPMRKMVDYLVSDGWKVRKSLRKFPRDMWDQLWKTHSSRVRLFIDIDGYDHPPLLHVLHDTLTTATLNFLSWNRAYAIFPRSTFIDKDAHILVNLQKGRPDDHNREDIRKLIEFGIKPKGLHWNYQHDPLTRLRRIGDSRTWTIEFADADTAFVTPPPIPDEVITASTFVLNINYPRRTQSYHDPVVRYSMAADVRFRHAIFRHPVVSPLEDQKHPFHAKRSDTDYNRDMNGLVDTMNELTKIQYMLLPENERPINYTQILNETSRENFHITLDRWNDANIPRSWTYYDGDLFKHLGKVWAKHEAMEEAKRMAKDTPNQGSEGGGVKIPQ